MIEVKSLSVDLDDRRVLDDVSFTALPGEFICLVGPNGAGKSTLLRAIAGAQSSSAGTIYSRQDDLQRMPPAERAARVSWLPQMRPVAWNLSVEDIVALGRFIQSSVPYDRLAPAERVAIDNALAVSGASDFKHRHIRHLSGGEQARVHLARAIASPADCLLLDEPCAALDISHQLAVAMMLAEQAMKGRLVMAAMHDLSLAARFATRIIVLDDGGIYADDEPASALSDKCLRDVFGVERTPSGAFQPAR
jgi:iron complex transport system ATP-binding protein